MSTVDCNRTRIMVINSDGTRSDMSLADLFDLLWEEWADAQSDPEATEVWTEVPGKRSTQLLNLEGGAQAQRITSLLLERDNGTFVRLRFTDA